MNLRQPPKLPNTLAPLELWLLNMNRELSARVPVWTGVPASSTAAGQTNSYSFDANFLYICYAADSWARIAWTDVVF